MKRDKGERSDKQEAPKTGKRDVRSPGTGSTDNPDTVAPDAGYVPTGGRFNDPNQWKTTPGFGQNFGEANEGAGYNPAYGSYEDFKAGRRNWRSRFQPGGANYEKDQLIKASILGAHPQTKEQLGRILNSLGIQDARGAGQSYYRTMMGNWDNNILGNLQIDPETGMGLNVGTSDVNSQWEHLTPEQQAELNSGFYGRLAGELGVGTFNRWQQSGKGSAEGQTANGLYYNHGADGSLTYWDKEGFETDEHGRRTGGSYMLPTVEGVVAGHGANMPIGTGPGHLLGNNPAQNPGDNGYNAPPTGTNGVPATAQPTGAWSGANPVSPLNTTAPGGIRPNVGGPNVRRKGMGGARPSISTSAPAVSSASYSANPGGTSLPSSWGGDPTQNPQNAVPSNTTATPALPGTVTTKTQSRLRPLEQSPQPQNPAYNPNLLRLSMLGGRNPLVV